MAEFLQSIILSDITLFLIVGLLMVLITWWAVSIREYAGYILGWLIGFLLILLMSVFFVGQPGPAEIDANAQVYLGPAMFIGVLFASALGLGLGAGALTLVRGESTVGQSRAARAIVIAIATSLTLLSGYLMIMASFSLRLAIAAFALSLAIGALFNIILMRQRTQYTVVESIDGSADPLLESETMAQSADPDVVMTDLPSPLAQRIQNLRQRARRFGE